METKILGLDPSTKYGAVIIGSSIVNFGRGFLKPKSHPPAMRLVSIAKWLDILMASETPDLAVIEGYSHQSRFSNTTQTEIGAVSRYALANAGLPYIEAAPTTLKKFVTGKGNSPKDQIVKDVYKRWGFEGTNDACDAFSLAKFGRAVFWGDVELPKTNLDAVVQWRKNNALAYELVGERLGVKPC